MKPGGGVMNIQFDNRKYLSENRKNLEGKIAGE